MKKTKNLFGLVLVLFFISIQVSFAQKSNDIDIKSTDSPISTERRAADPPPAQVLCCSEAADGTITCTERTCPTDIVNSGCCPEQATSTGGRRVIKLNAEQSKQFKAGQEVDYEGTTIQLARNGKKKIRERSFLPGYMQ